MIAPATIGKCPRCGAEVLALEGVALALAADSVRLALEPDAGVRLARRWAGLARALTCEAGACLPGEVGG